MTAALSEALPVVQRTPAWVEAREHGVGASEAAAALGISRWESRIGLWARKLGLVPAPEVNLAMRVGTALEPVIADLYQAETGIAVRRVNRLLRSRRHPFLLASLDRRRADGRLVEMKWTERGDGYGEPGTDEVPDEVLAQVIQQMAVTGAPAADIAVMFGGRRFDIYTVARDLEAEAVLVDEIAAFWQHVEDRTEPPLDGSEATLRALADIYPRDNGAELLADGELSGVVAELLDARDAIARLETEEKRLRATVEGALGDASVLVAPGVGRVAWKSSKDAEVTDWKALAATWRPSARLIAAHTTTKPGARRFLPRREEETHA